MLMLNQRVPTSWMSDAAQARSVGCHDHSFPSVVCRYWSVAALVKNSEPTKKTGRPCWAPRGWRTPGTDPRAKQNEPHHEQGVHPPGLTPVGPRAHRRSVSPHRRTDHAGRPPMSRARSGSAAMSRPWAVRAQITATQMAIMIELHTGWIGSHTKLATALPRATRTPDGAGQHVAGEDPQSGQEDEDPDDQVDPAPLGRVELDHVVLGHGEGSSLTMAAMPGQGLEDAHHHQHEGGERRPPDRRTADFPVHVSPSYCSLLAGTLWSSLLNEPTRSRLRRGVTPMDDPAPGASGGYKARVITDVEGVRVGHWTAPDGATGCTVVRLPEGTVASGEFRGGAPATRDAVLLAPEKTVTRLDAVVLSGRSVFGLAAVDGVLASWRGGCRPGHARGAGPHRGRPRPVRPDPGGPRGAARSGEGRRRHPSGRRRARRRRPGRGRRRRHDGQVARAGARRARGHGHRPPCGPRG